MVYITRFMKVTLTAIKASINQTYYSLSFLISINSSRVDTFNMSRSNFCETITRKYYHEALLIFLLICIICTESITFVNSFTLLFSTTSGFRKVQSSSTSSGSNLAAVSINDNDSKKKQFEDDKNFAVTDFGTHHEDINLNFSDNDDDDGEQNSNNEYQIFKGKNKWLGGAIDSKDGSIYGIPSNSKDIICLRPKRKKKNDTVEEIEYQIHLIPLPKSVQEGKFKWLRGIICNGCLYGIPAWSNDGILKLDIEKLWKNYDESEQESHNHNHNDVVSIIPLPEIFHNQNIENKPHRWLWHGAALNSNKTAIYCIPSNAHQVLKVDLEQSECTFLPIPTPTTDKTTYPSTPLEQTNKWYGGILGNDNAIYGIPYSAANVLRIDANTDTVSLLGDYGLNEYNWHGGIKSDRNGCIYCFPAHHSHVLKIDTNIKISHDASKNGKNDCRLSLVPIHRASYDKDEVTRYKWLGGSLGADGNIYGMPSDASSILR